MPSRKPRKALGDMSTAADSETPWLMRIHGGRFLLTDVALSKHVLPSQGAFIESVDPASAIPESRQ